MEGDDHFNAPATLLDNHKPPYTGLCQKLHHFEQWISTQTHLASAKLLTVIRVITKLQGLTNSKLINIYMCIGAAFR